MGQNPGIEIELSKDFCGCGRATRYQTPSGYSCNKYVRCVPVQDEAVVAEESLVVGLRKDIINMEPTIWYNICICIDENSYYILRDVQDINYTNIREYKQYEYCEIYSNVDVMYYEQNNYIKIIKTDNSKYLKIGTMFNEFGVDIEVYPIDINYFKIKELYPLGELVIEEKRRIFSRIFNRKNSTKVLYRVPYGTPYFNRFRDLTTNTIICYNINMVMIK